MKESRNPSRGSGFLSLYAELLMHPHALIRNPVRIPDQCVRIVKSTLQFAKRLAADVIARSDDSVVDSPMPMAQFRRPLHSVKMKVAVRWPISC